jgi:hypothetical protein
MTKQEFEATRQSFLISHCLIFIKLDTNIRWAGIELDQHEEADGEVSERAMTSQGESCAFVNRTTARGSPSFFRFLLVYL